MLHAAPTPWLNIDAGELDDEPDLLYAIAHGVNVACGGHAGDRASMRRVIAACALHATRVGAHPSYADREGFGRRATATTPDALDALVAAQCAALDEAAREVGARVVHAKAHGALYHAASADDTTARAFVAGVRRALGDVAIVGPAASALAAAAREAGVAFVREGFADRGVRADGSLVPRGEPGALVTDPARAAARAIELAMSGAVDTVCVHGDTPGALAIARAVRDALDARRSA